mmetsp:Transcript_31783/g.57078  ORF Transcript_31783/g.57078 Transcript_31783/m.57078 type:complete len:93 (-) Transcript_31783:997-1275(-)
MGVGGTRFSRGEGLRPTGCLPPHPDVPAPPCPMAWEPQRDYGRRVSSFSGPACRVLSVIQRARAGNAVALRCKIWEAPTLRWTPRSACSSPS